MGNFNLVKYISKHEDFDFIINHKKNKTLRPKSLHHFV